MSLKTTLLKGLIGTAVSAAASQMDGDPKTNAKTVLKNEVLGLIKNKDVQAVAIDELIDAVVTPDMFGKDEEQAEALLKTITENTVKLFQLAKRHA